MPLPDDLVPAKVQKVTASSGDVVVEVFAGRKRYVALAPGRVDVVDDKPVVDGDIDATLQGLLRKELIPGIVTAVDDDVDAGITRLRIARPEGAPRVLIIERQPPMLFVVAATDDGERILQALPRGKPDDGRDTRRGRLYVRPPPMTTTAMATAAPTTTAPKPKPTSTVPPELSRLRARLKAEAERLKRRKKNLEGDLVKHGDGDALAAQGELLKGVMGQLKRGLDHVDVINHDGDTIRIALDPRKDAKGNLERVFQRAKRAKTGALHARPRIAETVARLAAIEAARASVAGADVDVAGPAFAAAAALLDDDGAGPSPRRRAATSGSRQPWRVFVVAGGVVVRVGRGAKDNDALVKSARGNDLWLHARDRVGAHVVIPSNGAVVPDDVVLDAAHLAAWFSGARGETHVDIQSTRVEYLRKPGSGAAGLFLVANEVVTHLRVDDERVKRLLLTERAASEAEGASTPQLR